MKVEVEESCVDVHDEREDIMTSLSYDAFTSKEDKAFDNENLLSRKNPVVFPELPAPFNHLYTKFRNLNEDMPRLAEHEYDFHIEERPPHTAVEVGLKWTF